MKEFQISSDEMWYQIEESMKRSGGVYKLYCRDVNTFEPIAVNRVLKVDDSGILYIGKADCFLDRVADLKKSLSPDYKSQNHECGLHYKSNSEFSARFPFLGLFVQLYRSAKPRELEVEMIKEYESEFGELPPFNRAG